MNRNFSLPSIKESNSKNQDALTTNSTAPTFNTTTKHFYGKLPRNFQNPSPQCNKRIYNSQQKTIQSPTSRDPPLNKIFKTPGHNKQFQYQTISYTNKNDEPDRNEIMSRETLYRFYSKEQDNKQKRLQTPGYLGVDSVLCFYKKYQNIEREQEFGQQGYSPSTAYLTQVKSQKILPSTLGLMQRKGEKDTIKAKNLLLGKNYAQALSSSMKFLSNTQSVQLPGNRLGRLGGSLILSSLSDKIRNINLDNNKIGSEGLYNLVKWIDEISNRCVLENLSLENNNFGDDLAVDLADVLIKSNCPLIELNLSRNQIGDKGAMALADLLATHYRLKIVRISWNKIQTKGGVAIAEALKDSQHIQIFDGSFNQFGIKRNGVFGLKMGEACNNKILRHVDISYNSMNQQECEIFGDTIKENHTLWGLHVMGNDCLIDSMGFIRTKIKQKIQSRDILHQQIRDGVNFLSTIKNQRDAKINSYQCCWVCEGWREQKFEWKMGISGKTVKEPIYIHFDFDQYRPWLLEKEDDEGTYSLWQMVPPGKSYYFFSLGGENGKACIAKDNQIIKLNKNKHLTNVPFIEIDGEKMKPIEFSCDFNLKKLNYVEGSQKRVLNNNYEPIDFQVVVPRLSDQKYIRPFSERPRTPWSFPISIFKDYQFDTDEKFIECFEFDWSNMKFPKMSDDEMKNVKEELKIAYRTIHQTFKYLSAIGFGGNVFSIPLNCYTDFVKQINLVDGKIINFAESDTLFITVNKRTKNTNTIPGTALVRFQFLEILMRLAFKRYEETKEVKTKAEAVRMMFHNNLKPFFGELNFQKWREERYFNEEVDNIYKSHLPIFETLYKTFGCHYLKPGDKPFMMVDEFESIFQTTNLINDNFVSRDVIVSFNASMMIQVNELDKDRHMKAIFIEFLEGFGRACDKLSLGPPNEDDNDDEDVKVLTDKERMSQSLAEKIENALPIIYESCMTNAFKEKWKWPKRDPKTGLYKDKYWKKLKKGQGSSKKIDNQDYEDVNLNVSPEVIKPIIQ